MDEQPSMSSVFSTRVLDVDYKYWRKNISITDSATGRRLYSLGVDCRHSLLSAINEYGQAIGSSKVHSWSSRIDVQMTSTKDVSTTFDMRNRGILGGSPYYTSPAFDGQEMTWKNKAMSRKIIYTLIDGQGMALANFESDWKTKIGKLEVLPSITEEERVHEIVVTLLALLYRKLLSIQIATTTAVTA